MTKKTYKRISNVDETTTSTTANIATATVDPNTKTIQEKISDKFYAVLFISLSYFTIRYTNTIDVVLTSTSTIRPLLNISITLMAINTILFLYLSIYIPKIKGINVEGSTNSELWSIYCPRVIPIMTFNGIFCGILSIL